MRTGRGTAPERLALAAKQQGEAGTAALCAPVPLVGRRPIPLVTLTLVGACRQAVRQAGTSLPARCARSTRDARASSGRLQRPQSLCTASVPVPRQPTLTRRPVVMALVVALIRGPVVPVVPLVLVVPAAVRPVLGQPCTVAAHPCQHRQHDSSGLHGLWPQEQPGAVRCQRARVPAQPCSPHPQSCVHRRPMGGGEGQSDRRRRKQGGGPRGRGHARPASEIPAGWPSPAAHQTGNQLASTNNKLPAWPSCHAGQTNCETGRPMVCAPTSPSLAAPTCFLRSSGRPAPPQAGAGCAGMARSGCLAAAAASSAGAPLPAPQPAPLLIKFTVGSLPLFSFLQHVFSAAAATRIERGAQAWQAAAAAAAGPQGALLRLAAGA